MKRQSPLLTSILLTYRPETWRKLESNDVSNYCKCEVPRLRLISYQFFSPKNENEEAKITVLDHWSKTEIRLNWLDEPHYDMRAQVFLHLSRCGLAPYVVGQTCVQEENSIYNSFLVNNFDTSITTSLFLVDRIVNETTTQD